MTERNLRLLSCARLVLAVAALLGCHEASTRPEAAASRSAAGESTSDQPDLDRSLGFSANAKFENLVMMRRALAEPRHAADGGGRGWVESVEDASGSPVELQAGGRARIRLVYEAGPMGIAKGGSLAFQVSPFYGWDLPQNLDPSQRGYTEVTTTAIGLNPVVQWDQNRVLSVTFDERPLVAGERIHIAYGAGPELARIDQLAEREARLWFEVDGDGDGIRGLIAEPPTVDIGPGPAALLLIVLPTIAEPGAELPVLVSILDQFGSRGVAFTGAVQLRATAGLEVPTSISFAPEHAGRQRIVARAAAPGVFRVSATATSADGTEELVATSNPLIVEAGAPRLYWADLHGHSQLSDGTGTPEDYFAYARDVAGLDAVALTDHDHWGVRPLAATPAMWEQIRATTSRFHVPGEFVTLLGYEWTSWLHGHRHVLYFSNEGDVLSSVEPRYETPAQLWEALRGRPALTFAHHSAGIPVATNWNYRPDPVLEPVTEIVSAHGSSEAADSPQPVREAIPGNFVRDVIDSGIRFGFIGSGDSHTGHPGAAHLGSPFGGGLAAIYAEELTRDGILAALRQRRVYATNGPRIFLDVSLHGAPMGSVIDTTDDAPAEMVLRIRVVAEKPLERVDFVRTGRVTTLALEGELAWSREQQLPRLMPGEYHYIRVVQQDGGAAWSSPIYAE